MVPVSSKSFKGKSGAVPGAETSFGLDRAQFPWKSSLIELNGDYFGVHR